MLNLILVIKGIEKMSVTLCYSHLELQKSMKWGPWLYYWMAYSGTSALSFCDYVGESLANTLGITSPKYQYELDEYNATLEEVRGENYLIFVLFCLFMQFTDMAKQNQ